MKWRKGSIEMFLKNVNRTGFWKRPHFTGVMKYDTKRLHQMIFRKSLKITPATFLWHQVWSSPKWVAFNGPLFHSECRQPKKLCWWKNLPHQLIGRLSHYLQGFIHPRWLAGFLPSTVSSRVFCEAQVNLNHSQSSSGWVKASDI